MKLTTMTRDQIAFITDHPELAPFFTTTATTVTVIGDPVDALTALTKTRDRYRGRNNGGLLNASASVVRKLKKAIEAEGKL